ncbi:hypothetical protein NBT05_07115 [Aquimarina sp. ERC-38]|uniref:hypothetical protein n=1 Tax=Aquimarina sp. ERC-38 TaxID=2949996 RepID=UPI0022458F3E|nr:hypothetical protein [Aquimarina sp. ERC-38]UZO82238.1 hypothetical protein NBT05_07115 [Aquimarina sp. ERC-38]
MRKILISTIILLLSLGNLNAQEIKNNGFYGIETGYTITKVSSALNNGESYIIGNSYEGTLLGISYNGDILWQNKLSGFMNHDIWCKDINGDGRDEILAANADGTVYCLDYQGNLLWKFKKNSAPMYAVCTVQTGTETYVVAGGFDKSIYYLSPQGELVKEIKSSTYSIEVPRSKYKTDLPEKNVSTANFIRPIQQKDGEDILAVLGTNNHMNVPGTMYLFKVLENLPYRKDQLTANGQKRLRVIGDFYLADLNNDGMQEAVLGTSAHSNDNAFLIYNPVTGKFVYNKLNKIRTGYDVVEVATITENDQQLYVVKVGSQLRLIPSDLNNDKAEIVEGTYAFNDLYKDPNTNKILLASEQSGGSNIYVIDTDKNGWKKGFSQSKPQGKIAEILKNTNAIRASLKNFKKPSWQRDNLPVYLMTEQIPEKVKKLKEEISSTYNSPVFLNHGNIPREKWDRSKLQNEVYRKKRDRRAKYILSQDQVLNKVRKKFENEKGYAYWGGHGNDPFMYQLETTKKVLDLANGKKTVLIYPELEDHSENLNFVVDSLLYPLAGYAKDKNANIFLRSKNIFWLGSNYLKPWSRLMSGEFAEVFVPAMEETSDKVMELSISGRLGMWASGAVNSWGTRAVRDNTTLDRSRQYGYQNLPNHFLKMLIYHTAYGAQFINNYAVDQEYLSLYWELIAKGAIYVPKREEVLSFSPVHVSMKEPDAHFLDDGANIKWTVFYDEDFEKDKPFVFSRMNGSWPGAPVTEWDFSRYAAGVTERRLNFLPEYKNGMVLITPPQNGMFADLDAPRGTLQSHLHPLYKNIMKEYITDGRNYYSSDGKQSFPADTYFKTIEKDIQDLSKKLPVTVSGNVAWVVAQTSPKHLRLTLIENGYINPNKATAIVTFNTIAPTKVSDILTKETFKTSEKSEVSIEIPLGGFRFIDIELDEAL